MDCSTGLENSEFFEEIAVKGDADFELQPLIQRTERFPRLAELKLLYHSVKYIIDQVDIVLQRCPALIKFVIPQSVQERKGHQFANLINGRCGSVHYCSTIDNQSTSN